MKSTLICLIVVILTVMISFFHMVYTGDIVAKITGSFMISVGVLPFLIGGIVGCLMIYLFEKEIIEKLKTLWWIPLAGSFSALLPLGYFIYLMSQPGN